MKPSLHAGSQRMLDAVKHRSGIVPMPGRREQRKHDSHTLK